MPRTITSPSFAVLPKRASTVFNYMKNHINMMVNKYATLARTKRIHQNKQLLELELTVLVHVAISLKYQQCYFYLEFISPFNCSQTNHWWSEKFVSVYPLDIRSQKRGQNLYEKKKFHLWLIYTVSET